MRRVMIVAVSVVLLAPFIHGQEEPREGLPKGALTPAPKDKGWMNLLDETNAPEWKPSVRQVKLFEIKDSAIHIFGTETQGYVCFMKERLRDFALHIEFKVVGRSSSGIILRGETSDPELTGMKIQVLDDCGRPPTSHSSGALYDVATPMFNMSFPTGQWNSYDITCKGQSLVVEMNGWKVLDVDLAKMTMPIGRFTIPYAQLALDGLLFLQDHGSEVWYRNIFLKKLTENKGISR